MRRIQINPKYQYLRTFVEYMAKAMDAEGTYIYGGRRNLIKMFEAPDGTQLNIKRYKKPNILSNLVYSYGLRIPKGQRAYDYSFRLLERGIETPEAVAYIEERNCLGLLQYAWFVSIQMPYAHLLYDVGNAAKGTYEELAIALGTMAADMHEKQVLHQDFSPGNVLWDYDDKGYHFAVVDINRMKFGPVSMEDGCKSFARLWGPKRFIELIIVSYASKRGFDEAQCLRRAMSERARFWNKYQRKHEVQFKLEL